MGDSAELMGALEKFDVKAKELIHNNNDIITLEELLSDIVLAAEKSGMKKGILMTVSAM